MFQVQFLISGHGFSTVRSFDSFAQAAANASDAVLDVINDGHPAETVRIIATETDATVAVFNVEATRIALGL